MLLAMTLVLSRVRARHGIPQPYRLGPGGRASFCSCSDGRACRITRRASWRVNALGRISYSIFLVHFPVCLVVNAAFMRFVPKDPYWQALGVVLAWAASLAAGAAFFHLVESPLGRLWRAAPRPAYRYRPYVALPTQM
ncbi:hypothetical protein LP420_03330 [Massilia sp. B-10]|nr:hypothetical protein LP420_03330 [Massilia sp. B-10]